MKVVFYEDVEGTAQVGDVKEVKNGFARNFLLPRGLAAAASRENQQHANSLAQKESRRLEKMDAEAGRLVDRLSGMAITIEARVGENGRLFGSVTNRDVAAKLAEAGVEIDAHIIMVTEPIRELGIHNVNIRWTRNVSHLLPVEVVPDEASKAVLARIEADKAAAAEAEAKRVAEMDYALQERRGRRRRDDEDEE